MVSEHIRKSRTGGMDTYTQQIDLSVKKKRRRKEKRLGGISRSFTFGGVVEEW